MRQLLDETTSENSMIPQTSQKVGRKIVFMNENEIPYKKYRIESESEEEVIEEGKIKILIN